MLFVVVRDDAYVLMERCPKKAARHGGEWFIPGGRIEAGETPDEAMHREVSEELGISVLGGRALPLLDATGGLEYGPFLMRPFVVDSWAGEIPATCLDHPEVPLRWVSFEEASRSPVAVIRALMEHVRKPYTSPRSSDAPEPDEIAQLRRAIRCLAVEVDHSIIADLNRKLEAALLRQWEKGRASAATMHPVRHELGECFADVFDMNIEWTYCPFCGGRITR